MKKKALNINDVDVSDSPVEYTCFGLGSCVGLFVTDRLRKIAGGAHIPLADTTAESHFLDARNLIDQLLSSFRGYGSDLAYLRAKMTGGSKVLESSRDIGHDNAQAVRQYLIDHRIFIAAIDVGGRISRTARFNSVTEELMITTSDRKTYSL